MSKILNETIGSVEYDGLIVSNFPVADVVTISLTAGAALKRGTVVIGTAGAAMAPASAALAGKAIYILADDVDAAATTATAYRTGHFARGKLITNGTYVLTAADEEAMRSAGILLSDAI